jgi:hypothetical protein
LLGGLFSSRGNGDATGSLADAGGKSVSLISTSGALLPGCNAGLLVPCGLAILAALRSCSRASPRVFDWTGATAWLPLRGSDKPPICFSLGCEWVLVSLGVLRSSDTMFFRSLGKETFPGSTVFDPLEFANQ